MKFNLEIPNFIFTMDFWNLVVALAALLVALYSVYYTRKNDSHSIEITETYISLAKNRPALIMFSIFNNSNSSIKIKDVELLNENGSKIHHLDYEPEPTFSNYGSFRTPNILMPDEFASPFSDIEVVGPYEKLELSYYVNPFSNDIKIKITCDRPIHHFSKSKLFSVHFKKIN